MIFVANHRLILHFNHDHVFQADRINLAWSIIVHKDILATQTYMTANATNASLIRREKRPVLLPITHVIPTKISGNNRDIFRLLHYPIINGNSRQRWPDFIKSCAFLRGSHSIYNAIDFSG